MERQKLIQILYTLTLVLFAVVLSFGLCCLISQPKPQTKEERFHKVNDLPLLTSVKQVYDARRTGYCTFKIGNDNYVVEHLPEEYVEYSEWFIRMP